MPLLNIYTNSCFSRASPGLRIWGGRGADSNSKPLGNRSSNILLDTQASVSLFHDETLLENVHECDPINVTGIYGGTRTIKRAGTFYGMKVYWDSKATANVLSFREVNELYDIEWDNVNKQFTVLVNGKRWIFKNKTNSSYQMELKVFCMFLKGIVDS
mgnify:CR=1 FL=1